MSCRLEKIDLEVINQTGTRCGCCHKPITRGHGVTFGRPHFVVPAINICRRCVEIALAVLGPEQSTKGEPT